MKISVHAPVPMKLALDTRLCPARKSPNENISACPCASELARACCNYSIPGVKHITEQITEISFNFDVQFVQPAPLPGI